MQMDDLVPASDFCTHHNITISFLSSLQEYGLLEVTSVEENLYIPADELQKLEQIMRLHYELNINLEGVDVVTNLLNKVQSMQNEIAMLRSRLRLYED